MKLTNLERFIRFHCPLCFFQCVCVCAPIYDEQGASPLATGDRPTKRPVARAVDVPADSSWVSAGMPNKNN